MPLAAAPGDIENDCMLVKALLVAGANVESNDSDENTPLHHARQPSIVKILIEFGADIHRTNKLGHTPLICATRTNRSYPGIQPENRVEVCRLLISHGANINACGTDGLTALHSSVFCKDAAVAKYLLENGADIELVTDQGGSILHDACRAAADGTSDLLVR